MLTSLLQYLHDKFASLNALLHDGHFWTGFIVGSIVGPFVAGLGLMVVGSILWNLVNQIFFWQVGPHAKESKSQPQFSTRYRRGKDLHERTKRRTGT